MQDDRKTYTIGGQQYVQRPLTYGQTCQILTVIDGIAIRAGVTRRELLAALGDRLPLALAVVLTPIGEAGDDFWKQLRDKDLPTLGNQLEYSITPEQIFEVIDDFFTCNPIASVSKRLTGAMDRIREKLAPGSKTPSASSPEETSPSGNESSGNALPESQSPT